MATTANRLISFREFAQLPEPEGFRYELRCGETAQIPPAHWKYPDLQEQVRAMLAAFALPTGRVVTEMPFRALPEYEYRISDVAFVSWKRWNVIDADGFLQGAPDIVVEILALSSMAVEILDKEKVCLENGCQEFWLVDRERRQVKVSTPDGHTMTFGPGKQVPLPLLSGTSAAIDAMFATANR